MSTETIRRYAKPCFSQKFPGLIVHLQVIEREMRREKKHEDSLHKHAPGWNETLASESEAFVKVRNTVHPFDLSRLSLLPLYVG